MKLIIVSGPWSSGTTAVAGTLHHLGFTGFGPYLQIRDERAPVSYEFMPFRDLVLKLASEDSLKLTVANADPINRALVGFRQQVLEQAFGPFDEETSPPVFLKLPLSALLLNWLADHFELRQLFVARPLNDIERTRIRRNWMPQFGATGAQVLYSHIFSATIEKGIPTQIVHYRELLKSPEPIIRSMAEFCGHTPSEDKILEATRFITDSAASRAAKSASA